MRRAILALLALGVFCALGGGGATSASANRCRVSTEKVGNYKKRSPDNAGGTCEEPGTAGKEKYIITDGISTQLSPTEACEEVAEAKTGNYKNSTCTEKVSPGEGSFVKVTTSRGEWMVAGANLTTGTKLVKGSIVAPSATLTTKIGGNEVKFTCKNGELKEVELEKEGKLKEGGSVRFTECTTAINGTTQGACEPKNGAEKGVIVTNKGKGRLGEHSTGEGVTVIESVVKEKIEGKEVLVFGHVKMSEECSIGEDVPIIGSKLGVVDSSGMSGLLTEAKSHNIKEGPLTEIWAISETAEHKAKLTGEGKIELVSGETWSGLLP